ncbi:helix-turn-helix domain-containing protein [Phenylobacterium sp. VNQ135]|uniref:helix-turn-helix domain-containing protein n=1 Tax=Phenylobacterium sp. VNQ135 TaxID=3400922 RepID=UPI003C125FB8
MSLPPPRQTVPGGELPRHRHEHGYAAVVLSGTYEEAGDNGRRAVRPGDVVVHGAFEAHLNRTPAAGALVLNLPLPCDALSAFGTVADADAIARAAGRDTCEAVALLVAQHQPAPAIAMDWPDLLAEALREAPVRIGDWARAHGLSAEHVARGFRQVFGAGPLAYGREVRARDALHAALSGDHPLAEIAQATGFADQAHMTRAVLALSGRPPGAWRRSNPFKTGASAPAI